MENNSNMAIRVFLQPNRVGTSFFFIFSIISISFFIIFYYRDINNNWDKYKCKPIIMMTAGLFGKDSEKNLEECLKHTQSEAIYNSVQTIQSEIDGLNSSVLNLKNGGGTNDGVGEGANDSKPAQSDPLNNLNIIIQQNILSVKNAITKILGAFVLSTYMTQGAITTTQSLSNSKITKALQNVIDVPQSGPTTSINPTGIAPQMPDLSSLP